MLINGLSAAWRVYNIRRVTHIIAKLKGVTYMTDSAFKNKTAVITGAGGVLCGSFALALAQKGAKTALLDIDLKAAQSLAGQLKEKGYKAEAYRADVLDKESLEAARQKINADLGGCDFLINGAGGNSPKASTTMEFYSPKDSKEGDTDFFGLSKEGFEFVFGLNFLGTFLPSQVFSRDMLNKSGSSILNISSMSAYAPMTKVPAYSAAKAAVSNFTQWLAVYLSQAGIRVNALAPGFFRTKQNEKLLFNPDGTPTARTGKIMESTPMRRLGVPEDLNGALLFLLDPVKAAFITGVILPVDGGFMAYSGV